MLCPFLSHFGFQYIASAWSDQHDIDGTGPSPSSVPEIVGPSALSYLNQVAIFRLAQTEMGNADAVPGEAAVSAQSHQNYGVSDALTTHPGRMGTSLQDGSTASGPIVDDPASSVGTFDGVNLQLTEEDYSRMAGEISQYMMWDGNMASNGADAFDWQ